MGGLVALLIPLAGIFFPIFIIFIIFYFIFTTDYKKEKLKREERMKAIEKGVELPPEPTPRPLTPLDYLRKGMVALGVGIGLVIGGSLVAYSQKDEGLLFITMAGLIVSLVGVAYIIYYKILNKSKK
jgi:hypothetical protein